VRERHRHRWSLGPRQAIALQQRLARRVVRSALHGEVRFVAGADCAYLSDGERLVAGWVVWDVLDRRVVETASAVRRLIFPYVPGLLSFRESPALIAAARKLKCEPDALIFDAQGLAHPRRFGLACHVGVLLDKPSIGCAKSRLCGRHAEPAARAGSTTPLMDDDHEVGRVLRTRDDARPVYVSIGHRITLDEAVALVLRCCAGYRLPEPTRLADQLVGRLKREIRSAGATRLRAKAPWGACPFAVRRQRPRSLVTSPKRRRGRSHTNPKRQKPAARGGWRP